jgi:hypothetical protein
MKFDELIRKHAEVFEVVEVQKENAQPTCVIKIRASSASLKIDITKEFENLQDCFYDTDDFAHGKADRYFRIRDVLDEKDEVITDYNQREKVVQLSPKGGDTPFSHYYMQQNLTCLPSNTAMFLLYKFRRQYLNEEKSIFVDEVYYPVPYKVATFKVVFEIELLNNNSELCNKLQNLIAMCSIKSVGEIDVPVIYTKFMYQLRVSEHYKLYAEIFQKYDSTDDDNVESIVDGIYDDDQQTVDEYKEYLWAKLSLEFYGNYRDLRGMSTEESQDLLRKEYGDIMKMQSPFCARKEIIDIF